LEQRNSKIEHSSLELRFDSQSINNYYANSLSSGLNELDSLDNHSSADGRPNSKFWLCWTLQPTI